MVVIKKFFYITFWMFMLSIVMALGQAFGMKMSFFDALPIAVLIVVLSVLSIIIKEILPKSWKFPAFAWALLLGVFASIGNTPLSQWIHSNSHSFNFIATTTPLLAFAGLSMANELKQLKKISWKIIVLSFIVFGSVFFICAFIAHVVLKLQGII